MIIHVFDRQSALKISNDQVQRLVQQVIREEKQTCDEVAVYFVDTAAICELHEQFFQDASPTDCISFPMDEESHGLSYRILGDVFVCPETAISYANRHQLDAYEETTLYIVHGLLHLMGYDDLQKEDRRRMRRAETRHMRKLKNSLLLLHSPTH